MEIAVGALQVVTSIAKRAALTKNNKQDCAQLASLAGKTEVILNSVIAKEQAGEALDTAIDEGVNLLLEALQQVDKAVARCQKCSYFVSVLRASQHHSALKQASTQLSYALDTFPLLLLSVSFEVRQEVQNLSKDLQNVHFEQTKQVSLKTTELQSAMELGFNENQTNNFEIKEKIEELMSMISVPQATSHSDIEVLKNDLAKAKADKDRLEEFELNQIIAVLESKSDVQNQGSTSEVRKDDGPPRSLLCPISHQLMKDPVLVLDSCMTYDRECIEEWFSRGHKTDPITNLLLSSLQVVPNIALRGYIALYRKDQSISEPSEISTQHLSKKAILLPGLYTATGTLIDDEQCTFESVLLLEPDGNVQGAIFSNNDSWFGGSDKEFRGEWVGQEAMISFKVFEQMSTHIPLYEWSGNVMHVGGSKDSDACFVGTWRKNSSSLITRTGEDLESGTFHCSQFCRCPPVDQFTLDNGLIHLDGGATGDNGYTYPSTLVLLLKANGKLQGWQTEVQTDNFSSEYSIVVDGEWSAESNTIAFKLFYGPSAELLECYGTPGMQRKLFTYVGKMKTKQIAIPQKVSLFDLAQSSGTTVNETKTVFEGKWFASVCGSYDKSCEMVKAGSADARNQGSFCYNILRSAVAKGELFRSDHFHLLKPLS